jgi:hypothetical protein
MMHSVNKLISFLLIACSLAGCIPNKATSWIDIYNPNIKQDSFVKDFSEFLKKENLDYIGEEFQESDKAVFEHYQKAGIKRGLRYKTDDGFSLRLLIHSENGKYTVIFERYRVEEFTREDEERISLILEELRRSSKDDSLEAKRK